MTLLDVVDNRAVSELRDYYSRGYLNYLLDFTYPIVATVLIALFTIIFWIIYENYYLTKLLKMKPEVN